MMQLSKAEVIRRTKEWIRGFVIRHQLCPFAGMPFALGRIRYAVVLSDTPQDLLERLASELYQLTNISGERIETTLVIHPNLLHDFTDYLDFVDIAENMLSGGNLEGIIQLASFHPRYQFSDTEPKDPANKTNQSPFQMLHLLRESSITEAIESFGDTGMIPERNIETMQKLYQGYDQPEG